MKYEHLGYRNYKGVRKIRTPIKAALINILKKIEKVIGETVKREDFQKLSSLVEVIAEEVKKLASAQRKTEERLNELAEEVKSLASAQRKTEEELRKLVKEHEKTRKDLGSLTLGYFLENESYKYLPALLERDYNLKVLEPLDRKFIEYPRNRYDKVNIFGKGRIDEKEV